MHKYIIWKPMDQKCFSHSHKPFEAIYDHLIAESIMAHFYIHSCISVSTLSFSSLFLVLCIHIWVDLGGIFSLRWKRKRMERKIWYMGPFIWMVRVHSFWEIITLFQKHLKIQCWPQNFADFSLSNSFTLT